MRPFPLTPELIEIARRVVWFEDQETALADPVRFMAYAMERATFEDMAVIRRHVTDEEFIEAIDNAPPGIIQEPSWSYWNLVIANRRSPPPLPKRRFD